MSHLSYKLLKYSLPILLVISISACEKDTTPPGMISNLTAEVADGQVTLSWTEPLDPDLNRVEITQDPPAKQYSQSSGDNGITITELTNGTSYEFTVVAVDEEGNRSNPAYVSAVPNTPFVVIDPDPNDIEPVVYISKVYGFTTTAPSKTFSVDLMGYIQISVTFDRPFDVSSVLSGQTIYFEGNAISAGGITFSEENTKLTFISAEPYPTFSSGSGGLAYFIYPFNFVLVGDDAGNGVILDSNGMALDGDGDGIPGGDYVLGLSVMESSN